MTSPSNLEIVRSVCLALPGTTEQEAWGEPTFRVARKIFVMMASSGTHHTTAGDSLWCNAPLGVQEMLVRSAPERFFVPPYVGVKGWIGVRLDALPPEELEGLVLQSYCMIAPKKLQAMLPA